MMNVHGIDREDEKCKRWLGDMDRLHLPRSLVVQLDPKDDNTYLKGNYDPPWFNQENKKSLECYDPL
jgi:hypothetical protein